MATAKKDLDRLQTTTDLVNLAIFFKINGPYGSFSILLAISCKFINLQVLTK